MKPFVAWRNWADQGTLAEAPEEEPGIGYGLPIEALQRRQLGDVWRMFKGSEYGPRIAADLGRVRPIDVCAFIGLNPRRFPVGANQASAYVMRVLVATDAGFVNEVYSGYVEGTFLSTDRYPSLAHFVLPYTVYGRYVRVSVEYTTPDDHDYYEAARLWIGDALSFGPEDEKSGYTAGWRMGFVDRGALDASDGEQNYESTGKRLRRVSLRVETNEVGAYGFAEGQMSEYSVPCLQAMQLEAGTTSEVIAVPRIGSTLWAQATGVYGHVEREWEIEDRGGNQFGASLAVVEER